MITLDDFWADSEALLGILAARAEFLSRLNQRMIEVCSANAVLFRRPPTVRIKSVRSIIRKLNDGGTARRNIRRAVASMSDIAGMRLTIATQDQYEQADRVLVEVLGDVGEVEREDSWRRDQHENGYCADHYVVRASGAENGVKAEVQVRTLAHDLWAVFTHYESYKTNEDLSPERTEEIRNYSRLLDVSDHYAKLIRERRIRDANEYHQRHTPPAVDGTILTVDTLLRILQKHAFDARAARHATGVDGCGLLRELSSLRICTQEDLIDTITNRAVLRALAVLVKEENEESGTDHPMELRDGIAILGQYRNAAKGEFRNRKVSERMLSVLRGHVRAWKMEMVLADRVDGTTYLEDGKGSNGQAERFL
jgi:ppGpp synthetase/RelA/SpoT-type nucleotidyltranferase